MEYRVLGPLEVLREGQPLDLGGLKQRALLAVLLLHANEVVSVDRLIDEIWEDTPPDSVVNVVQTYVSRLRRVLNGDRSGDVLVTKAPGYVLHVAPGELDVERFQTLVARADQYRQQGDLARLTSALEAALALWRGEPLADFSYHSFAQKHIEALREKRAVVLEDRIQAELDTGAGAGLVGELRALVTADPLRERLRAQLMLALYRAGRHAEALAVYRDAKEALSEELGIDPGPELQSLERAILNQDPALLPDTADTARTGAAPPADVKQAARSILVTPRDPRRLDALLAVAEPLARGDPQSELVLCRLLGPWEVGTTGDSLTDAVGGLEARRAALEHDTKARVVAFTSTDPGSDLERMLSEMSVDVAVTDGLPEMFESDRDALVNVLQMVSSDVAVAFPRDDGVTIEPGAVVVPFGGAKHDWAALQLASRLARAQGEPLRLLGAIGDVATGRRDASRLLGSASLLVQRMTGIVAEPLLIEPGTGVLDAVSGSGLVVMGISDRWRDEGLGELRHALVESRVVPCLVVRAGSSSYGPASTEWSRYTWSRARDPGA